jgi:death-on-curing protein
VKIRLLSLADVLFIHSAVVDETGGSHGIRDLGLTESAVNQVEQTFDGKDLYPTLYDKAAILFVGLLKNHPFVDGNKRTALAAVGVFLRLNGRCIKADPEALFLWVQECASARANPQSASDWIRSHIIKEPLK